MEPEHPATVVEPSISLNLDYRNVVDVAFLRTAAREGLTTVLGGGWITRSSIADAPGEVLAEADYFHSARDDVLVRLPAGICHLILSERSLTVRVAAPDRASATRVREEVAAALPEVDIGDREVPVRFWWWQPQVAQDLARMLPSPAWSEIEGNYVEPTREQLSELMRWRSAPPAGGRLLLWHGQPGTGKTSAIRSLTGEWRSWAEVPLRHRSGGVPQEPQLSPEHPQRPAGLAAERTGGPLEDPRPRGLRRVPGARRQARAWPGALQTAQRLRWRIGTGHEGARPRHHQRTAADPAFRARAPRPLPGERELRAVRRGGHSPVGGCSGWRDTGATLADLYAFEEGRSKVASEHQAVGFAARAGGRPVAAIGSRR